ncbi:MAG: hypothetical protein OXQ28_13855, partial [Acidobacteriota bacterium]|nr:hypothetical protein [Acidobacteriota bacterium]
FPPPPTQPGFFGGPGYFFNSPPPARWGATPPPATPEDRQALKAARDTRQTGLQAISATAAVIDRIATRILVSPPPEGDDDGAIH